MDRCMMMMLYDPIAVLYNCRLQQIHKKGCVPRNVQLWESGEETQTTACLYYLLNQVIYIKEIL